MTAILALPVYGFDVQAANNQDLRLSFVFVDDQIAGVTIYNGGSGIAPAGYAGTLPFSGSVPVYFTSPISGVGHPAIGTGTVVAGVLTAVTLNDRGQGYQAAEFVQATIPGFGSGVVLAVTVGNPLLLDGLIVDAEVRRIASDPEIILAASTQSTIGSFPTQGQISIYQNVLTMVFLEAVMIGIPAGSYVWEARAQADGAVAVIIQGSFTVSQGVAFERG